MITGNDLIARGWPQGPLIRVAIELGNRLIAEGAGVEETLARLEEVRRAPDTYCEEGHVCSTLAYAVRHWMNNQPQEITAIRETPLEAPIWGREMIDDAAVQQLENAMRLPVTVAGALMPDAHVGYGIPIGGVVALKDAVAPYMVGVDIACRMMMSIYPTSGDATFGNHSERERIKKILREETRFGIGANFDRYSRRQHDVMDDPDWSATKLLGHLKDKGYAQLGTSGSGNHFVDAGVLEVTEADAPTLGIAAGRYLAFMSHSGSRGVGATIADHYSKLAQKLTRLPDKLRHLAWLPMSTEAGQEYWTSMNLAGKFASACHHTIHRAIAKRLGERPALELENHHNFCIARGQWIPTTRGPVAIEDLCAGDVVYAFDEARGAVETPVLDVWSTGTKPVVEIETSSRRIRCSGEHPILTVSPASGELVWRTAGSLELGDIVVCAEGYYGTDTAITSELARFTGAFLGDGWIRHSNPSVSGYGVGFAIGSQVEPHTARYLGLAQELFPGVRWHNNAKGAYGLSCSSRTAYDTIVSLGLGDVSRERSVPSYIFSTPIEERLAFLAGYIDADGSVSANVKNLGRGTIAAVSEQLVRGVREVAISCGLRITPVRATRIRTNFGETTVYRCTMAAGSVHRLELWHEKKKTRLRETRLQSTQGLSMSACGGRTLPSGVFAQRVRRISESASPEEVFDLTVADGSHSFICEGIVVHNCWREKVGDRELYVHRKGATPAHEGVLGIVPGSQGTASYIVRGRGSEAALNSASHGAGRVMSRTAARNSIPKAARDLALREAGVELMAGGIDESPQVYKDIDAVLDVQTDLVERVARFEPRIVLMSDDGKSED